jgi:cytochrome c oxidase cbb3-type subunit III
MADNGYQHDKLKDHDFDGIQEYDNQLPAWLMNIFYVAIVWTVFYFAHYHFHLFDGLIGTGRLGAESLAHEEKLVAKRVAKLDTGPWTEAELVAEVSDASRIADGAKVWNQAACASCHTAELWGNVGSNLRDAYWLHPITLKEMVKTIAKGRNGGQMPAHERKLSRRDIQNVVFYIVDTNLNTAKKSDGSTELGKAPEGERKEFPHLSAPTNNPPEEAGPAGDTDAEPSA